MPKEKRKSKKQQSNTHDAKKKQLDKVKTALLRTKD